MPADEWTPSRQRELVRNVHFIETITHTFSHSTKGQMMKGLMKRLLQDEAGFIVSTELVLIATLLVIGVIVGMSEVQHAVVSELNDVADGVGSLNQSYKFAGFSSYKKHGRGVKAVFAGSHFRDHRDECDNNECDLDCLPPNPEAPKGGHNW